MKDFFVDLHVHIGRNGQGRPVKITASERLTFAAVIRECLLRKGLDMVGVVDCACTGVLQDMRVLIDQGELMELPEGGLRHRDRVTVVAGAEVEAVEESGGVSHHLCFFPYLRNLAEFSKVMSRYITNMELSSQRCGLPARELQAVTRSTGGILLPAHAFTPHKSAYGNACQRLGDLFGPSLQEVPALELGLSADTALADHLAELEGLTYLSNSDAHSPERIGREYNVIRMHAANFRELALALHRTAGRGVVANYGLDPRLGRYHRSYCLACQAPVQVPPPALACPTCGASDKDFVRGVLDRVLSIADRAAPHSPPHRPPYHYQVPLAFVPGLTRAGLDRLLQRFGSEMAVLHQARSEEMQALVGRPVTRSIMLAREGRLPLQTGGGGHYGKVASGPPRGEQLPLFPAEPAQERS